MLFTSWGDQPEGSTVVTALALIGKSYGFWSGDVEVRPVDGAWLAPPGQEREAVELAVAAAEVTLAGRAGTVAWVRIGVDGTWATFEDLGGLTSR